MVYDPNRGAAPTSPYDVSNPAAWQTPQIGGSSPVPPPYAGGGGGGGLNAEEILKALAILRQQAGNRFSNLPAQIGQNFDRFSNLPAQIGQEFGPIMNMGQDVAGTIGKGLNTLGNAELQGLQGLQGAMPNIQMPGMPDLSGIEGTLQQGAQNIMGGVGSLVPPIPGSFGEFDQQLQTGANNILDGLGLGGALDWIQQLFGGGGSTGQIGSSVNPPGPAGGPGRTSPYGYENNPGPGRATTAGAPVKKEAEVTLKGDAGGSSEVPEDRNIRIESLTGGGPAAESLPPGAQKLGNATVYEIQPGDSLSLIGSMFGLTYDELIEQNPGLLGADGKATVIHPGQKIVVNPTQGRGTDERAGVRDKGFTNGNDAAAYSTARRGGFKGADAEKYAKQRGV
jgi:LysM repeat protein